jgi:hypothetical protein
MTSNGTATAIPVVEDGLADTPETGTGAGKPIKVPVATWPAAVPSDEEAHVMSIICGNSHLHWALHNDAREENLNPNLCEFRAFVFLFFASAYLYFCVPKRYPSSLTTNAAPVCHTNCSLENPTPYGK